MVNDSLSDSGEIRYNRVARLRRRTAITTAPGLTVGSERGSRMSTTLGSERADVALDESTIGWEMATRVARFDWRRIGAHLDADGYAMLDAVLLPDECDRIAGLYDKEDCFRSRIIMARHGFGQGEYKYFAYPLPSIIAALRTSLYPRLVSTANAWNAALGIDVRYPAEHAAFLERCRSAGQTRPTPLLLRYREGDFNALHQDLYGEHVFPLQVAFLLSRPAIDFTGGEFVLTEQRPRMQSRVEVVPLRQGDAVIFAVHHRPAQGKRGSYRVTMRHGVSRLRSGSRHTVGVIFHDAA